MGEEEHDLLFYLSQVIGWIYFFAWSFSFYGQVIENYTRKSVVGLSFDFEAYNLLGFIGYSVYTIWGYIDPDIGTGHVAIQDIVFALHAVLITIITIIQIFIYHDKNDPEQKVSSICKLIITCLIWGVLQIILIERVMGLYDPHEVMKKDIVFNSVIYLGWCKVFISFIKYMPQAYYNYRRKSTEGWSIMNILLDFTGGSFSFAQNVIDKIRGEKIINDDNLQSHTLNIAKFALSFVSITFDIVFMIQHYCLYRENTHMRDPEADHLINSIDISKGKYDYIKNVDSVN